MQSPESFHTIERRDKSPMAKFDGDSSDSLQREVTAKLLTSALFDEGKTAGQQKPDKPTSVFTEPFDKIKAASAIRKLGDDDYDTREKAQNDLQKMGPKAIPQLREALESKDPEVKRRAQESIEFIEENAAREAHEEVRRQYLEKANKLLPDYAKLLAPAGARMDNDSRGTNLELGKPKAAVTKEQQRTFDQLLKTLDEAGVGSEAFKDIHNELSRKFHTGEASDEEKKQYYQLDWLKRATEEGRLYYATALSVSEKPEDKAKAVGLLLEHLTRCKRGWPSEPETTIFLQAGGDKDPAALKRYKELGGTDSDIEKALPNKTMRVPLLPGQ
jgi:hypothetical protein